MTYEFVWFVELSLVAMSLTIGMGLVRLLIGPTLPDRVVALDFISVVAVGALGLLALAYESTFYLDIAGILALIAFVSSVAFARYLERRCLS